MRPKTATCNQCNATLALFMEKKPSTCPVCQTLIRYEEFGACETCGGQVQLGRKRCESCKSAADPTYSPSAPNTPGTSGSVN